MSKLPKALLLLVLLAVASLGLAVPAQAVQYVLDQWNAQIFEQAGAKVTVDVTLEGGNTKLVVAFIPGTLSNTLLGIDQFGYESPTNCCLAGSTAGWAFTKDGNMDGFGNFDRQSGVGGGTDTSLTFIITGDITGALNSASDFAAHLRFAGIPAGQSCSGFVGGENIAFNETDPHAGCKSVSEPGSLAFIGSALMAVAMLGRRWMRRRP